MADKRELLFSFLGRETISPAAKKAGKAVEDLGDEFKATGHAAKKLDREIDQAKHSLAELAVEFAHTQDAAGRLDITKKMREQQRELSKLTKAKKFLPDFDEEGKKGALSFVTSFGDKLAGAMKNIPVLGTIGPAAGATIAAAAAPVIGGAIAAAVVGGAGIGGVVGGLALVSKDPRVANAAGELGKAVMKDVDGFSQAFVRPALQGIGIFRQGWNDVSKDVERIFKASSQYVTPLARGVAGLAKEALPGIRKAVEAAGPVIREISSGLPRLGRAIGNVFGDSAENADEAAASVKGLFLAIEQVVKITGGAVRVLSDLVGPVIMLGKASSTVYDTLLGWIPGLGSVTQSWRDNWNSMDEALKNASNSGTTSIGDLGTASKELANEQEDLRRGLARTENAARTQRSALDELADAIRAQTDPMFALIEAQKGLKDSQNEYTKAVKEHGKNSPQAKEALRDMAKAALEVESATGAAAGMFNGKLSPAMKATLSAAGFTESQIKDLEKQFQTAQAKGESFAKNYQASAGLTDNASAKAIWIKKKIGEIKGKTVTVNVKYEVSGSRQGEHIIGQGTQLKGLASGGPVKGPGPKGVDSEPRLLAPGEFVLSDKDVDRMGGFGGVERFRNALRGGGSAPAMAGGGTSAGGGIVINVGTVVTPNPDDFIEQLRKKSRGNGGIVKFIDQK